MPRYEQLKLNQNKRSVPKRTLYIDDENIVKEKAHNKKLQLAKPLIVASTIIIIFAIIFSTIKTYGDAVSIAIKDFFRVPQMEARSLDATASIATNERASFLSNLPMFNFFVRPEDNNIVAITAEESTNSLFEAKAESITEDMFKEFEATTRITRDALLSFFNNNKISTGNSTNNNIPTFLNLTNSALNTNSILSSVRFNNSGFNNNNIFAIPNSVLQNINNISTNRVAKNSTIKNEIVEADPFKEILKPQKKAKPKSTMKPIYTKRYRQHNTNLSQANNYVATNRIIYVAPIAKNTKSLIKKPTKKEIAKNRKEFYERETPKKIAIRKISNPPNSIVQKKEEPVILEIRSKDNLESNKVLVTRVKKNKDIPTTKNQDDNIIVPSVIPRDKNNKTSNVIVNSDTYKENNNNIVVINSKKNKSYYTKDEDYIDIVIPNTYIAMNNEKLSDNKIITKTNNKIITANIKNETYDNNKMDYKNILIIPSNDDYTDNSNNISEENIFVPSTFSTKRENNTMVNEEEIYREDNTVANGNTITTRNNIERNIQSDGIIENNNIAKDDDIIIPSPIPQNLKEDYINNSILNNNLNNENDIISNDRVNIIDNSKNDDNIFRRTINRNNTQIARSVPQKSIGRVLNKNQNPGIFLAEYDDELGTITLVFKERDLRKDYTIEDVLISLLDGATDKENENNIISVIPRTVRLLDIFRENNTLYLNFDSSFDYNPLGDEGMLVQLYQIVYTATQFENIDEVIFLIDGNYNEFIGAEGSIANIPFKRLGETKNKVLETSN